MMTQAIAMHPWPLGLGLLLLLVGPWILRKAGGLLLIALAVGVAAAAYGFAIEHDLLPATWTVKLVIYCASVLLAVVALRHPIVTRDTEVLFVLALCLLIGETIADLLSWSPAAIWIVLVAGTLLTPTVPVAVFSAALLCLTFRPDSVVSTTGILLLCLAAVVFLHGGWRRGRFDRLLARQLSECSSISAASAAPRRFQVVFRSITASAQASLMASLERQGIRCEELLGGYAGAEIPLHVIRSWQVPWSGLYRSQPDWVFSGSHTISLPPDDLSAAASDTAVDLDDVAQRIRSHAGSSLSDNVATGRRITGAIIDTGCNPVTPQLRRAIVRRESFVDGESADDARGHGTAVAACVLAVARDTRLISLKSLNAAGAGTLFTILKALKYAADHRHEIDWINLSLGARLCKGCNGDPLCRALSELAKLGVPSIASIGNEGAMGAGTVSCPGSSPGTIGVGATDTAGRLMPWSSRGPCADRQIRKPDVVCYGAAIKAPNQTGAETVVSGTSFSAPLVAGILSGCMELARRRSLSVRDLYALIRHTCTRANGTSDPDRVGHGIANLKLAVDRISARTQFVPIRFRSHIPRLARSTAAVAAIGVVVAATWWFALDHIGMSPKAPREALMLGRVRQVAGQTQFDDGTGVVSLHWNGASGTEPRLGTVILVRGDLETAHRRVSGTWRLQLWSQE